ncbi:hypothetical protein LWI28_000981 [Acer negundo]|uniref:Uncharacterized protein n=1 Tax=Acer negundo TaxID=4023 RepID=A0AAD5JHZ3_ACENE|nr:hypothetical protein LWI28_000981 [Acer negundo]
MNQPGKRLGVFGLGGLGHMAELFGKAFGLHVTVFSTSASKKQEALNLLGAENFLLSNDEHQMKIEIIPIQFACEAFERMMKNDVKYRFVIDNENSLK